LILRIHKEECAVKHTPQTIFVKSFLLVVSLGTQLRCLKGAEIIKSPAWTTTFIPVAGLDTCKWYLMRWNNYPAPSAAQLFTMLLHRKHFCFYFHYIDYKSKINATISQKMLNNCDIIIA